MPEGIGYAIDPSLAPQQENPNVSSWKQFLMRPENIATALVLAAGITSERRPEQSKVNKALEAGVAGLGFRGALEGGVQQQRGALREEQRTAEAQAADIAAQQQLGQQRQQQVQLQGQQVAQGAEANRIAREQLTTPTPLNPSEIAENQSQAGLYDAQAAALGRENKPLPYVDQMIMQEIENASAMGRDPDLNGAIRRGMQTDFLMGKIKEGKYDPLSGMVNLSPEEMQTANLLGLNLPEAAPAPGTAPTRREKPAKDKRRVGGGFTQMLVPDEGEVEWAVRYMRQVPGFEEMDANSILDKVEEARTIADNDAELAKMSQEQLETLLGTYNNVLSREEARKIRLQLQKRGGTAPASKYKIERR